MQASFNLRSLTVCGSSTVRPSDHDLARTAPHVRWLPTSRYNPPNLLSQQITSRASTFGNNKCTTGMHHATPRLAACNSFHGPIVRDRWTSRERISANAPLSGFGFTQHGHFHCPAPPGDSISSGNVAPGSSVRGGSVRAHALGGPDIALVPSVVAQVIDDLGLAALIFLATTVVVVPTCKQLKVREHTHRSRISEQKCVCPIH